MKNINTLSPFEFGFMIFIGGVATVVWQQIHQAFSYEPVKLVGHVIGKCLNV